MSIEALYSKRRQIRQAWDEQRIPDQELIQDLLKRTLKISPSKQNLYPFKIHVIGPGNPDQDIVSSICCLWDKSAVNNWNNDLDSGEKISHKKAPWVLIFESRLCEPNTFVKGHSVSVGDDQVWNRFTQCDPKRFRENTNTKLACIEVGMFIQTLAGLCLENDLAISYIRSFPEWSWRGQINEYHKDKNKKGLNWESLPRIKEQPLMIVQIGYKANIRDELATNAFGNSYSFLEDKPSFDQIVSFDNKRE